MRAAPHLVGLDLQQRPPRDDLAVIQLHRRQLHGRPDLRGPARAVPRRVGHGMVLGPRHDDGVHQRAGDADGPRPEAVLRRHPLHLLSTARASSNRCAMRPNWKSNIVDEGFQQLLVN